MGLSDTEWEGGSGLMAVERGVTAGSMTDAHSKVSLST